ncbi:hypothetical protein BOX15_Mlig019773g2 [Macrostomum lignano]|uniref:Kinetochore protein NUF2 n=1 Tax=Macrostomum lignano TaxID=282301 RepID=A0A267FHH7_9PLAT|nr:hypothetical protein BOX15_Mlig019773g2 [Macrostomum lignano]
MSVHKYPPLSADSLVQHLNVYLGTEIVDEHELLSTETTQQVFVMLVYRLTGISVSSEDQEQQSPGGYAPTSNQDKQVALLSFALPSLLKAAHVNCPITISDICSQLAPDRTKRLLDVLSGLVNLLVYYQKCTKTQLDKVNSEIQALTDREKALCAEAAANQRQVAEFESAASQAASLTRQVESTRTKLRSRENELSAEQHAVEELVCRREAQDQEVVGQEAIAKSMRARKAKLAEQAVASPEGLFHLKSKMEEDVEQRKVLLEARYKRLEEVKSQGRAAKSQLRVSELPALFDEADRHRQVLAQVNESVEAMNAEAGPREARLRLLAGEVKAQLSALETLATAAAAAENSTTGAAGPAGQLREGLASVQARLTSAIAKEREAAERIDEVVSREGQSRAGLQALKSADREVARSLARLADRLNAL